VINPDLASRIEINPYAIWDKSGEKLSFKSKVAQPLPKRETINVSLYNTLPWGENQGKGMPDVPKSLDKRWKLIFIYPN
jgi:hypothetical protein